MFISFPQIAVRLLYKVRFCFILWKLGLFLSQQTSKQPFSGAYADKLFAVVPIPLMFCLFHIYPLFHLPLILLILLKAKHNNKTRLRYSSSKTFLSFCLLFPFLCTFLYLALFHHRCHNHQMHCITLSLNFIPNRLPSHSKI